MSEPKIKKLQNALKGVADYAVVNVGPNFFYLTGVWPLASLERPFFLIVPSEDKPFIIAPELYAPDVNKIEVEKIFYKDGEDPFSLLAKRLKKGTVLIDDLMSASHALRIQMNLDGYSFDLLSAVISKLRAIKDENEVELIKKAASIVDRTFKKILQEIYSGITENELAQVLNEYMMYYGADGFAFETIVASGPNSAEPHHLTGNRKIRKGDAIIMDYGARYRGYVSDITRTVYFGSVDTEFLEVYESVKKAQEAAINFAKPGVEARDVDRAARSVIEAKGYGPNFTHRTGHGIGVEVHEQPFLDSHNTLKIENNMVFTVEPGIYLEGKFGVRIEDDVIMKNRSERLTKSSRSLITI
ncbi:MAG: M24 family metallopeptidase [Nitrososphaeria archaeon]|nr:Xaa-Pro peptidase family protein [Conexivisphaerales archaeon]